jgi:hypothetical protein
VLRPATPVHLRFAQLVLYGQSTYDTAVRVMESDAGTD